MDNFKDHASFTAKWKFETKHIWDKNYWSGHNSTEPKYIEGELRTGYYIDEYGNIIFIYEEWYNVDEHPAQEPYDIEV